MDILHIFLSTFGGLVLVGLSVCALPSFVSELRYTGAEVPPAGPLILLLSVAMIVRVVRTSWDYDVVTIKCEKSTAGAQKFKARTGASGRGVVLAFGPVSRRRSELQQLLIVATPLTHRTPQV